VPAAEPADAGVTGEVALALAGQPGPPALPNLHSFAAGSRRDLQAVTAGLTLPYSSGAVEGNF